MTIGGTLAFEMMGATVPPWVRPEQFTAFVVAQMLVLRATIIPCTVRGTRWIAAACAAPIPVVTYFFYRAHPLGQSTPLGLAASATISSLLIVAVTTVITETVHGLRERVRQAMKLGQYTLEEKIGEGGMGVVYKASHALLRRPTAIKLLPPERAGETNLVRFEREVQLTSLLTHPNTVSVYDFGRTPEGSFYYAMEYLEGLDLQQLIDVDGPQDPGRVVRLLAQICGALAEAHAIGLIHRDVKPANVLLCERGGTPDVVKVLDFGLVKQLGAPQDSKLMLSAVNQIVGTPLYLSPEAITTPNGMDGRSDLYAVGAVGYLLLTGTPPFTGNSVVEVCGHHLHTPPTPPSARLGRPVPAELEQLVLRCLAKSRDDRPRDAARLRDELIACELGDSWPSERATRWWVERGRAIMEQRGHSGERGRVESRAPLVTRELRLPATLE
jgi:serine/threonine-protein kinase